MNKLEYSILLATGVYSSQFYFDKNISSRLNSSRFKHFTGSCMNIYRNKILRHEDLMERGGLKDTCA